MSVRFRIRTTAGQELSFASRETFEDFVRSGDLSPDDLVYDGETGSWSSARAHPLVLEIEYEDDDEDRGGEQADPELGLDLAPVDERSPEEEARAFLRKMEAERESELDVGAQGGMGGFKMDDSSSLADMLRPVEPAEAVPGPPVAEPDPPSAWTEPPREPHRPSTRPPRTQEPTRRHEPTRTQEPPRQQAPAGAPRGGRRLLLAAIAVLAVGGGYLAYRTVSSDVGAPVSSGPDETEPQPNPTPSPTPPPRREPVIASTQAAVRERARERYLTATRSELRDLQPIPQAWPTGPYLSTPSAYPEVADVWQGYLTTIRRVRDGDGARYRAAYEAALDDAAVDGEERGARLTAGIEAFRATREARMAHYARVESLASAAVQSHGALLGVEGLILYDQAGSGGGRGGLGRGTSARDENSRLILEQVLDVLSTRLDGGGLGPREPSRVREWVWDGLLNAVTG